MAYSRKLERKIANLEKAFSNLHQSQFFDYEFQVKAEVVTKRFEYTFEALWKTLKLFLNQEKGLECYSPTDCLKSAYQTGMIPEEYEQDFIRMVRKRNEIVHIYNEPVAYEIYNCIVPRFIEAIGTVVEELKQQKSIDNNTWKHE